MKALIKKCKLFTKKLIENVYVYVQTLQNFNLIASPDSTFMPRLQNSPQNVNLFLAHFLDSSFRVVCHWRHAGFAPR